jgi:prepilin-type N-terminal cleavage/methylation domain-containing protein
VRRGFSTIELLVVLAIIVILASIALAAVTRAKRAAILARVRGDFQAIANALDQYKADFGEYPGQSLPPGTDRYKQDTHMLARALIGPGAAASATGKGVDAHGLHADGADGPGFRAAVGGKIWPAYLSAEKFKVQSTWGPDNVAGTSDDTGRTDILDYWGNPIEYLPRRGEKVNPGVGPILGDRGIYDTRDGIDLPSNTLLAVLGDANLNNKIDKGETLRYSGPFILASPGPDGKYVNVGGAGDSLKVERTDDIYSFER